MKNKNNFNTNENLPRMSHYSGIQYSNTTQAY